MILHTLDIPLADETVTTQLRRLEAKLDLFAGLIARTGYTLEGTSPVQRDIRNDAVTTFTAEYIKLSAR